MTRREELERRYKNLSTPNNGAWAALVFQVAALIWPEFGLIAIPLILFWLFAVWMARLITAHEIAGLAKKEQQAEADAIDFIRDRNESLARRMQANLEAGIRAQAMRSRMQATLDAEAMRRQQGRRDALMNGSGTERFMGKVIDVTPEKS